MKQLNASQIKKIEVSILEQFDKICRENNLRYSIAYGTMIGCIRHKGFIPWDDDVDVIMPREDYEKLLSMHYKNDNYEIKAYQYSNDYYYPFAKMIDSNTLIKEKNRCEKEMGIFIDIFPLDFIPKGFNFEQLEKITEKHGKKMLLLGLPKTNSDKNSIIKRIKINLFVSLIKLFRKSLLKKGEKKFYNIDSSSSDLLMNQFFVVKKGKCHSINDWNNIKRMKFEDIEVSILANYDTILRGIYGDYMQLPPVEEQKSPHAIKAWIK